MNRLSVIDAIDLDATITSKIRVTYALNAVKG